MPDAGQLNALLENQDAKRRPQLDAKFIDALAYKVENRYPCFHRAYIESITFLDTLETDRRIMWFYPKTTMA